VVGPLCAHRTRHTPRKLDTFLILYLDLDFKRLRELGKEYPWPRPKGCPQCGGARLWGHGYVARYFDGLLEALWMKRYRCPDCGAVHTLRPSSHWRGFLAPWRLILVCLLGKLRGRRWLRRFSRQRQQYWWKGFAKQVARQRVQDRSVELLRQLWSQGIILSTHSLKYCEVHLLPQPPHRILAVTPAVESG
jgi:hypothetical protein